jgi:hypothetical protein
MEDMTRQQIIQDNMEKAEQTLEKIASGHKIDKVWIAREGVYQPYIFSFFIDGGEAQTIIFSYRIMANGRAQNNSHYIENCVREKLKSIGF